MVRKNCTCGSCCTYEQVVENLVSLEDLFDQLQRSYQLIAIALLLLEVEQNEKVLIERIRILLEEFKGLWDCDSIDMERLFNNLKTAVITMS